MLTACMLGRRFAIVTFTPAMEGWYEECVAYNGLGARCAGIFCLGEPFADIAAVAQEKSARWWRSAPPPFPPEADACILGGAPLAGLAGEVADQVAVPLVDGVAAAVRQAETLVALRPRKAIAGTFRRPPAKRMVGVSGAMQRLFEGS